MKYKEIDKAIKNNKVKVEVSCQTYYGYSSIAARVDNRRGELVTYGCHGSIKKALIEADNNLKANFCCGISYSNLVEKGGRSKDSNLDTLILNGHIIYLTKYNENVSSNNNIMQGVVDLLRFTRIDIIVVKNGRNVIHQTGANIDEALYKAETEAKVIVENGIIY